MHIPRNSLIIKGSSFYFALMILCSIFASGNRLEFLANNFNTFTLECFLSKNLSKMFANFQKDLLGMNFADIKRLMFGVIKNNYNPAGIIKLSERDKEDLVWYLIGRIFEKSSKFDPSKGNAACWMWAIAKNELVSYLQGEQNLVCMHSSINANPSLMDAINEIIDESTFYTSKELDAVDAVISTLDKQDQLILNLYRQKVSEKEIAHMLGLNYNTVRQKVRRLKEELRRKVNAHLERGCEIHSLPLPGDGVREVACAA